MMISKCVKFRWFLLLICIYIFLLFPPVLFFLLFLRPVCFETILWQYFLDLNLHKIQMIFFAHFHQNWRLDIGFSRTILIYQSSSSSSFFVRRELVCSLFQKTHLRVCAMGIICSDLDISAHVAKTKTFLSHHLRLINSVQKKYPTAFLQSIEEQFIGL